MTCEREQASAFFIGRHDKGVFVAKERREGAECGVDERVEVGAGSEAFGEGLKLRKEGDLGGHFPMDFGIHRPAVKNPVHIDAAQIEDLTHAGLRGNGVEARLHSIEGRAIGFGSEVEEVKPELIARLRRDH